MKKVFALVLAGLMAVSMTACRTNGGNGPSGAMEIEYDELSQQIYDEALGEFYIAYQQAKQQENVSRRQAMMAIAEAKLLASGVFLPTSTQGGNYALTRVAPYTNPQVLWGNDSSRFHDRIVTTQPIQADHYREMKEKWLELVGTGTYESWLRQYLGEHGYQIKNTHITYYDADPEVWDVLATSNSGDSEILVNTYDGLYAYDMENVLQPALAESHTVTDNADGTQTYTFRLRQGVKWVDSQGREIAPVRADDFVAGMQHMMDAAGGLERLIQGIIVNADAYISGEITDFSQVGVKAVDDSTLTYTLRQNTPYFMTMLSYGVFAPLCRTYYESMGGGFGADYDASDPSYAYGKGPDSIAYCGPFVITNYTARNTIVFAQNTAYWDAAGSNLKSMTFRYDDGSNPVRAYNDFNTGTVDGINLTAASLEVAKRDGVFDRYGYVSATGATTYNVFVNLNRVALANYTDAGAAVSSKTPSDVARSNAAMRNRHFRMALAMSLDRGAYNAQSVGEELKLNSLRNSYTPGNYVNLAEEVTVQINGQDRTYPAGTMYGQILQDQLDADGVRITVWNGSSGDGFDGWYDPDRAAAELEQAIAELTAQGIQISRENPIRLDLPYNATSETVTNRANVYKRSVETALGGAVVITLVPCSTRDIYLDATYWFPTGAQANYDISTNTGWGPDYGDPQTYLDTMLPQYAGYMTKCIGIF
ncbi:MAG: peptide ABC transporter substrate-binding protein [Oscillospiraceae bacterium]|nr:peptide ABC transporter substrate-binding protein [Oscillospiraceae bacterium]